MRRKVLDLSKEELENCVLKYKSVGEILISLDIRKSGASYTLIRTHAQELGVLLPSNNLSKAGKIKRIPTKEILVENSTYQNSGGLKKRILKEGLLAYICVECGQIPLWNSKLLVLQLDHINGIPNDNRLENLRFLCPNCHTQTETFSTKRFKVRTFCFCGTEIDKKSKVCMKHRQKHTRTE